MRRRECLQPSIKYTRRELLPLWLCKQKGQIQWTVGLFFLLFLGILLCSLLQLLRYHMTSIYLEDTLAASNLASAVVDLEEYGISHEILISEPNQAYIRYCSAVKGNLNLNEEWECTNKQLVSGAVSIVNYTVYNVQEGEVIIYSIDENGQISSGKGELGAVRAPNGILIESTSIYSEISFTVKGLFGMEVKAHKGKLVDIVASIL